jgi:hypothetical protein
MGKQVRFYMTHEDEKLFLASISDLTPVRLVYQMFSEPSHMNLESFAPIRSRKEYFPLCMETHLCLVNAKLGTKPKINFNPPHLCSIDKSESEVVEFHRCETFENRLMDGRLWFTEQDMGVRKSDGFVNWANLLLKWVRMNYERDTRGIYASPNALELSKSGKLHLGPSVEPEVSLAERKRIFGLK